MYSQMMSGEKITPYLVRLLVDTEDEIATLPTHFTPGSTCEVVATSSTYRLNNQGQWIKQKSSGGGGGGSADCGDPAGEADREDARGSKACRGSRHVRHGCCIQGGAYEA